MKRCTDTCASTCKAFKILPCFPIKRPCLSVSNTKVMRSRRASTVTVASAPYVLAMPSKYSFVTRAASSNWSTVSS